MTTININQLTEGVDYVGQRFGNTFDVAEYGQPVSWIFPIEIAFHLMGEDDFRDHEGWNFSLTQEQIDEAQIWAEDNLFQCDDCGEWYPISEYANDEIGTYCLDCFSGFFLY